MKVINEKKQINWNILNDIKKLMTEVNNSRDAIKEIKDTMNNMVNQMNNMIILSNITTTYTMEWARGFRSNEPSQNSPKWGDMDMASFWNKYADIILFHCIYMHSLI
jgi:hypothetical protein